MTNQFTVIFEILAVFLPLSLPSGNNNKKRGVEVPSSVAWF